MKTVGILNTGLQPEGLNGVHGSYPDMIRGLLGNDFDYEVFDVSADEFPGPDAACGAYIITGSAADAYSDTDWIVRLRHFLRSVRHQVALVGICFGHQVMAEAFGGRVARSPRGWGIGIHSYAVTEQRPWMDGGEVFSLIASHRDQIVQVPPSAKVIASSHFCPVAAIEYSDYVAISMQAHPEFSAAYARDLLLAKPDAGYTPDHVNVALTMLDELPTDAVRVGGWIRSFLETHVGARRDPRLRVAGGSSDLGNIAPQ